METKSFNKLILFVGIAEILLFGVMVFVLAEKELPSQKSSSAIPESFRANIVKEAEANQYYRKVLFTGLKSQLVVMSIPPGTEVGEEIHKYVEQTLFFLSGSGEGMLNDKKFAVSPGDVVVVVSGTKHNFWNTGTVPLKLYTVYAPPNHIDGRVHTTRAIADADTADEAIGEAAPVCAK